jgi:NitT/TauT family transport system substrate-binding protein
MSCCTDKYSRTYAKDLDRRTVLKGMLGLFAGLGLGVSRLGFAQGQRVQLAFCSQLLCVIPYEVTLRRGYFAEEGLDVELVYVRGGAAAMQALVGGAVDYAATSLDVALQAFSRGAEIQRFASTGQLPLFALAVAPRHAETITEVGQLEGRTVGINALGTADHALVLYLLEQAGADAATVEFATLGPNLYDALRLGQVDAGMVQEPALSLLLEAGGRVLVNFMDLDDAERYLGGTYEFMGVSVRAEEAEARFEEMQSLARALAKGLEFMATAPTELIVDALPSELIAGGEREQLEAILERHRHSLYPTVVNIDLEAAERVKQSLLIADMLETEPELEELFNFAVVGE